VSGDGLLDRLNQLGLRHVERLRLTRNRVVMVSFSRRRVLSVHEAYRQAPDRVLKAIVRFVAPGTSRDLRSAAQHEILSFHAAAPIERVPRPARPPERPRAGDPEAVARLELLFAALNQRHFMGSLPALPIRLSGRMRTRLGHVTMDDQGRARDITISRRHLAAHGWDEVEHTLLHEMVHVWQSAQGRGVDHGPDFRAKAREVGVAAAARRWVKRPRSRQRSHEVERPATSDQPTANI